MLSMFINRMSSFMSALTSNPRISSSTFFGLTSNMLRKLKSDRDVFLLNHFVNSVSRASHSKRGSKSSGDDDESDHGEIFHVALLALGTDTFLELASHLCRLNRKTDEERRRLSTWYSSVCVRVFVTIECVTVSRLCHRPTRHSFIAQENHSNTKHSNAHLNVT